MNISVIEERQDLLDTMRLEMFSNRDSHNYAYQAANDEESEYTDSDVVDLLETYANKQKVLDHCNLPFDDLQKTYKYPSPSEADYWLLSVLSRVSNSDSQCIRIFRHTTLGKREKAYRKNYPETTLRNIRGVQLDRYKAIEHGRRAYENISHINGVAKQGSRLVENADDFRTHSVNEVTSRPLVEWLIKFIFPILSVCMIYGPSGSGKTFLALYQLMKISRGESWFGYRTKPVPVVYVGLEGQGGLPQRFQAYQKHMAIPESFRVFDYQLDLGDRNQVERLVSLIKMEGHTNGVVVVDTVAASAPGLDENTAKDMGVYVHNMHYMKTELSSCVVLIHHAGKDTERGVRGWSGIKASMDAVIKVEKDKDSDRRSWFLEKSKDGRDGLRGQFLLQSEILGVDVDGDEISSCVVEEFKIDLPVVQAPVDESLLKQQLVKLVIEYNERGKPFGIAQNSEYRAYKVLSGEGRLPVGADSHKIIDRLLCQAESDGLIRKGKIPSSRGNNRPAWLPILNAASGESSPASEA